MKTLFENIYTKAFDYFCTEECPCKFKDLEFDNRFVVDQEKGHGSIVECEDSIKALFEALEAGELYKGSVNFL